MCSVSVAEVIQDLQHFATQCMEAFDRMLPQELDAALMSGFSFLAVTARPKNANIANALASIMTTAPLACQHTPSAVLFNKYPRVVAFYEHPTDLVARRYAGYSVQVQATFFYPCTSFVDAVLGWFKVHVVVLADLLTVLGQ